MTTIDLQPLQALLPKKQELDELFGDLRKVELYEIHITVKHDGDIQDFKDVCADLKVKPLVVQLSDGRHPNDVMTSSSLRCSPVALREECIRIIVGLMVGGWEVVRCKIECSPSHAKCQVDPSVFKPFQYFESHIPVTVSKHDELGSLRVLCRVFDMHMSANAWKVQDDMRTIMITYRSSSRDLLEFQRDVQVRVDNIKGALFHVEDKVVVEFAVFDSNRQHDNAWINHRAPNMWNELDREDIIRMIQGCTNYGIEKLNYLRSRFDNPVV